MAALFIPDGYWRDVLAFTWTIATHSGRAAIEQALQPTLARTGATGLHLPDDRSAPRRVRRAGTDCIETIFEFDTASGHANAVVRLVESEDGWRAWSLLTTLETLHGWPDGRPPEVSDAERYSRDFGGANWLDQRQKALAYTDRDPAVVVVGGGQAGLSIAARLKALGVDTLIVDRHERIGDNWRRRYHSLTLHNEVHVNHLPLMPFPPTFPVFIPKDKLASWFEVLCRGARPQLLDRHRAGLRQLRRRGPALDPGAAPVGRHRAHAASAPRRVRDRRQRDSDPAAHPRPR